MSGQTEIKSTIEMFIPKYNQKRLYAKTIYVIDKNGYRNGGPND